MRNKTKALSGAAQDAYFRRVLKAHSDLSTEERECLLQRLRQDVAQLRIRAEPVDSPSTQTATLAQRRSAARRQSADAASLDQPRPADVDSPFDPFTPNVIVVLRQRGREAALAALAAIDSADKLRLLAREQRLSVGTDLDSATELRTAIVAAAERRVANRLAAAS